MIISQFKLLPLKSFCVTHCTQKLMEVPKRTKFRWIPKNKNKSSSQKSRYVWTISCKQTSFLEFFAHVKEKLVSFVSRKQMRVVHKSSL